MVCTLFGLFRLSCFLQEDSSDEQGKGSNACSSSCGCVVVRRLQQESGESHTAIHSTSTTSTDGNVGCESGCNSAGAKHDPDVANPERIGHHNSGIGNRSRIRLTNGFPKQFH